jgi:hypothetical protein
VIGGLRAIGDIMDDSHANQISAGAPAPTGSPGSETLSAGSASTGAAVALERTAPAPIARIGLLGAAAAAFVAVGILVAGATATPAGTLAAGTDAGSANVRTLDGGGRGFGFGHGHGGITITAISGSSISLETLDGWTRTITVDSGTAYTESGETIALSDLAVGDAIRFQQTLEDDGTFSIDAVAVIPPHAGGEVTAISGSSITLSQRDGTTATVTVNDATTYEVNGTDGAALADIEVGMLLVAQGTENSDGSLAATEVRAADPGSFGGPGAPGGPGGRGHHGPGFDDGGAAPDATSDPETTSDSAG